MKRDLLLDKNVLKPLDLHTRARLDHIVNKIYVEKEKASNRFLSDFINLMESPYDAQSLFHTDIESFLELYKSFVSEQKEQKLQSSELRQSNISFFGDRGIEKQDLESLCLETVYKHIHSSLGVYVQEL